MRELIELEERGWQALSTEGDAGKRFYADILHEDAVMLLPGGLRIEGREKILESLGAQPWESFHIERARVIQLSTNAAALIYKVTAHRKDQPSYVALISSTYMREKTWQLVLHQQTPV